MRNVCWWMMVGAVCLVGMPHGAWADQMDLLLKKLVERGVLTETDATEIRQEVTQELARANPEPAPSNQAVDDQIPAWVKSLAWSGDIRLRYEGRWRDTNPDRHLGRFRLRVGVKSPITDHLEAGLRVTTGTNLDPVSPMQSFQDNFDKKDLFIDQAYLKWMSDEVVPLTFWGGKFETPFAYTPLTWDADLTPEGVAASLTPSAGPVEFFVTSGLFPLDELNTDAEDPLLFGSQAGLTWSVAKDAEAEWLRRLKLKTALTYYDYKNLKTGLDTTSSNRFGNTVLGSSTATTTVFAHDMNLMEWLGEVNSVVLGQPVKFFTGYVENTAAADNDEGWLVGVKVGKASTPWSLKEGWEIGYNWERLEADAAVGQFADSDFGEGGTNRQGHIFYATLATMKHSTLGVKWYVTEVVSGAENGVDRFQVDWNTKF